MGLMKLDKIEISFTTTFLLTLHATAGGVTDTLAPIPSHETYGHMDKCVIKFKVRNHHETVSGNITSIAVATEGKNLLIGPSVGVRVRAQRSLPRRLSYKQKPELTGNFKPERIFKY
jgi:hypothetical protein